MSQYFFDLKSSGSFARDEEGIELPDTEAAHDMALGALIDAARDAVMEGSMNQRFVVEVRDGTGPILEVGAKLSFQDFQEVMTQGQTCN